jgi:hypothetical protein
MNQPMMPQTILQTSRASYDIGYLGPNDESVYKLGAGMYSLSSRSNVPYVTLVGAGGFNKTFSWGEIVEVPLNQSCAVKNSSYHGGDIFINGGCDYDNAPARITVPCGVDTIELFERNFVYTPMPADCRRARRAYFHIDALNIGSEDQLYLNVIAVGQRLDGSHFTDNEIRATSGLFPANTPGVGYQESHLVSFQEMIGPIPLGQNASIGDDTRPHALLTIAQVYLTPPENIQYVHDLDAVPLRNCYYTLEY